MKAHSIISFSFLLGIVLPICVFSCHNESQLDKVLTLADSNYVELEKVLNHYKIYPEDHLKYRAACFLIENMQGHYSYKDTSYYNRFYSEFDSIAEIYKGLGDGEKDEIFKRFVEKHKNRPLDIIPDYKFISSDYLIDNIDRSFKIWEESEWCQHLNFDQFCEYILPYKVDECQDMDNWKEYMEFYCDGDLRKFQYCDLYRNSAYKACETVNEALDKEINVRMISSFDTAIKRVKSMINMPFGLCHDYNVIAVSVMRAKGIPCAMDFTPQWPFRSLGHSWCVLLKNTGKTTIFEGVCGRPATPHKEDHKMAKVFRNTYARNEEVVRIHNIEKKVPPFLRNVSIKDVTDEYMETVDIEITVNSETDHKYAYLAVFDNSNWVPVHWGKIKGKKVSFEKMGKNIVYLPVFYNERIEPFADPFLLSVKGEVIPFKADILNKRELVLSRKFPPFPGIYEVGMRVIGGRFEAANNPWFNNPDTIHTITEYGLNSKEIKLDSISKSYRYWRYYPPNGAFCNIAELYFFEKDSTNATIGKIIGTKGSYRDDRGRTKEAVFDRNILTFFDAPGMDDCWVGMDFGKAVDMARIVYFPRSDGNCIEVGDNYELFYWRDHEWQSLGKRVGNGGVLNYDDCPDNALFWLHNRTKGTEERIFTYENNRQIWW